MSPDKRLTDILCCPSCSGDLELSSDQFYLNCLSCGESFRSNDGIFEMFRRADLNDSDFLRYRKAYEAHASEDVFSTPSDITQWSCLKTLRSFMGTSEGELILDVGSADGKLGEIVSGSAVCYDISLTYLKAAQEKGLPVVAGRAEVLPFKSVFDIVVLSNILEHVPHPGQIIEQVVHVLKPGGRLYIVVPYREDLSWQEGEDFLDPHLSSFDLPKIRALLRNFSITRKKLILFTNSRPLYFLKSGLKKGLSPNIFKYLRETKKALEKPAGARKFSRWRHELNYLPNALVVPFFRPYSILVEAKPI